MNEAASSSRCSIVDVQRAVVVVQEAVEDGAKVNKGPNKDKGGGAGPGEGAGPEEGAGSADGGGSRHTPLRSSTSIGAESVAAYKPTASRTVSSAGSFTGSGGGGPCGPGLVLGSTRTRSPSELQAKSLVLVVRVRDVELLERLLLVLE